MFPKITAAVSAAIAPALAGIKPGSISMPTETKKIAANMSRTGAIRCSTCSPSPDSATSDPAMNAPSATE
jgi:hypothetical protein